MLSTTPNKRTYSCYEVQWTSGVGGNRHLERIISGIYPVTIQTVNQRFDEKTCVSQSAVPVLEEPIGTTFPVNDLDFAGVGRGIDESGQEKDGEGKSVSENHFGKGVKGENATDLLLLNTWLLILGNAVDQDRRGGD